MHVFLFGHICYKIKQNQAEVIHVQVQQNEKFNVRIFCTLTRDTSHL